MFIPYEDISKKISLLLPEKLRQKVLDLGYRLKIKQNLAYIKRNQTKVLKKLKNKKVLNAAFYVYDAAKWKCQSVYDLMEGDKRFDPYIFVTKNAAPESNFNYQSKENVLNVCNFFQKKNMKVVCGYDIKNDRFIPMEKVNPKPDIIIYQHPWYVETSQGPVVCSKFALTYYIPYYLSETGEFFEYDLRFHRYIYKYYVVNDSIREFFAKNMPDKGKKLRVTGHPQLDYYHLHKENRNKKYVIYAPHWSVCGDNIRYSTFDWSGYRLLEFAKSHPEIKWVFKPHPNLYDFLISSKYMTKQEADEYYKSWSEVGIICNGGDYTSLFQESYLMITDSGSFLTEYFITANPCIHLVSEKFKACSYVQDICSVYYEAKNVKELDYLLEEVLLNKNDIKQKEREEKLSKLNFKDCYAAENILKDIITDL